MMDETTPSLCGARFVIWRNVKVRTHRIGIEGNGIFFIDIQIKRFADESETVMEIALIVILFGNENNARGEARRGDDDGEIV